MSSIKSPAPRRSSRASTPTRATSPRLASSTSTPSISSLAPPPSASSIRKSASTRALSPKPSTRGATATRPALPLHQANKLMPDHRGKLHKVKMQTLRLGPRTDETILIARVKCPVPKGVPGHVIKRFDTNAVSATSLFRAAFPTASEDEEAIEMAWIAKGSKQQYGDTRVAGVEHSELRKLSGIWIPAIHAHTLAGEYGIAKFAAELIDYVQPDSEGSGANEVPDSEDGSPAVRSPRTKRQRLASPSAPTALSGASGEGVSILQTLSADAATGITTTTTEVKVDVPILAADIADVSNGLIASDDVVAEQIEQAKQLVETLKESGTLANLDDSTTISNKRALEDDVEAEQAGEDGDDDENTPVDTRGFFGKMFRRGPTSVRRRDAAAGRKRPNNNAGAVVPTGETQQQIAVIEEEQVEGRRWVAGFGLALAVGATAAAPYIFG